MAAGADPSRRRHVLVPKLKNVSLEREVAIIGDPGATIDGGRPAEKYVMFKVDAASDFPVSRSATRKGLLLR
jgi:hypothetical protein